MPSCLRGQDFKQSDFTGAYLQGQQTESERTLARPPPGFLESDERGVQVFWLMLAPLYGQCDAGAVWNRTLNKFLTAPGPVGLGFERASNDPCIYSKTVPPNDDRVIYPLCVDDARVYNYPTPEARAEAERVERRRRNASVSSLESPTPTWTSFSAPRERAIGHKLPW